MSQTSLAIIQFIKSREELKTKLTDFPLSVVITLIHNAPRKYPYFQVIKGLATHIDLTRLSYDDIPDYFYDDRCGEYLISGIATELSLPKSLILHYVNRVRYGHEIAAAILQQSVNTSRLSERISTI